MARYAVFRTSSGYGPEADGPAGDPPVAGAVLDGSFSPYGDIDEQCHRWVLDLPDLEALDALCGSLSQQIIIMNRPLGRYGIGCGTEIMDGVDGILEVYDAYRE